MHHRPGLPARCVGRRSVCAVGRRDHVVEDQDGCCPHEPAVEGWRAGQPGQRVVRGGKRRRVRAVCGYPCLRLAHTHCGRPRGASRMGGRRRLGPAAGWASPERWGVSVVHDTVARPVGNAAFVTPATFISSPSTVLLLQATVEPDADGDGYGDTSQDCQPSNAASQACPVVTPSPESGTATPLPVSGGGAPSQVPAGGTQVATSAPRLGAVGWTLAKHVIIARTAAAVGTTHGVAARSGRAMRRGSCRASAGIATCTVRVVPGQWRVSIRPRRDGVARVAATRQYLVPGQARAYAGVVSLRYLMRCGWSASSPRRCRRFSSYSE